MELRSKKSNLLVILTAITALTNVSFPSYSPCMQKDFGHGSFVCVCNATYCDQFLNETEIGSANYVVYTSTKDGQRFNESLHSADDKSLFEDVDLKLFLNASSKYQKIFGFGGAFTGICIHNFQLCILYIY